MLAKLSRLSMLAPLTRLSMLAPLLAIVACSSASVGTIGAVVGVDNETGAVFVRETREGLAADKSGLLPGDEILMIDGLYARDIGAAALRDRLRGAVGSTIELTVVRGDEVLRVKLVRQPLAAAAPAKAKEERIGP
jgi:C-terminal processing protease CtpA/Prc